MEQDDKTGKKAEAEKESVLADKEKFGHGSAKEELKHMGEKTREAGQQK